MSSTDRERNEEQVSSGIDNEREELPLPASGDERADSGRGDRDAAPQTDTDRVPIPLERVEKDLAAQEDPLLRPRPLGLWWRLLVAALTAAGGTAGGWIGWAVASLGCEPPCGVAPRIVGATLGAGLSGLGMAVLGVLIARSFMEWAERNSSTKAPDAADRS